MLYVLDLGNRDETDRTPIISDRIAKACGDIVRALRVTYIARDGIKRPVQGDMTKALYANGLCPIARRMLYNVSGISRYQWGARNSEEGKKHYQKLLRGIWLAHVYNLDSRREPQLHIS